MKLMHYSMESMEFDRARRYTQPQPYGCGKPIGFWVSVEGEDDWPAYVEREASPEWLRWAYKVHVDPDAKILRIDSPEGIDLFHQAYATQTLYEREYTSQHRDWPIDWPMVAEDYDGIIIAPYQWSRRMSPHWYYNWDCASGCLFTTEAINTVTLVARPALYAGVDHG